MTWDIVLFWLCAVVTVGIAGPVLVLALVRWCFRLLRRPDGSDGHGEERYGVPASDPMSQESLQAAGFVCDHPTRMGYLEWPGQVPKLFVHETCREVLERALDTKHVFLDPDQSEGNAGNRAPGVLDEARRQVPWQYLRDIRPVLKPGSKPPVLVSTPPERDELFELMSQPSQCIIVDDDEPFYPRKPPAGDLKPLPYRLPYDGGLFRDEDEIDRIRRRNRNKEE